ncbi:RBBP9/YdeN family alpha/beta hydrolase [Paenibacillus campi]|uniref:RBBP9/YdeN family alpha/beta hydrolase n=1 Tax=Paenibacillus campi TaxID=3106031 RepID=UPI002AFFCE8F|nr:alpha/beta fold hydrolase [Paenibacillus sp. SGZ-1014]
MGTSKVYIVHGYMATPQHHWFAWLQEQLAQHHIAADILALPNSSAPDVEQWLTYVQQHVTEPNHDTFLVGHSLGCVTILNYLQRIGYAGEVGGAVLVSGFDQSIPNLPALDRFVQEPLHYEQLTERIRQRAVIAAEDDNIVPFEYSVNLAERLQAQLYRVQQGGHFLDVDGYVQFPLVYDLLWRMIQQP